jgi:tetratricopeptide (TPR) repeat protein
LVDRNANPSALVEGTALLEAALQTSPDSAAIMDSLGWAYFRAKDYAKAKPLLQQAYDLKRDPEVAAHLGELLWVTGNAAAARKLWVQGLAIDPKHKILNSTLKRLNIKL